MPLAIRRVNPTDVRDAVVEMFWRLRRWPQSTKEDYYRYWDWRYSSLADGDQTAWIAMDGDRLIGHIALHHRRFRLHGESVRGAIPGNFIVDPEFRHPLVGVKLAGATKALALSGELDVVLGYGNPVAHALFTSLGFREIGHMQMFIDVRRWDRVLGNRFPGGSLLGPIARAADAARKAIARRGRAPRAVGLMARELSPDEVLAMDRSHWAQPPRGLVSDDSARFVLHRYLMSPFRASRCFGIFDETTGRLEGYVITEGAQRVKVWDCQINVDRLAEPDAVDLSISCIEECETALIPLLPRSSMAQRFTHAGSLKRALGGETESTTAWSALWRPDHPMAHELSAVDDWKVWFGWSHH